MTSMRFLEMYETVLGTNGLLHLKTDNGILFDYTLELIKDLNVTIHTNTHDLYGSGITDEILSIKTTYEKKYLEQGLEICYLSLSFK